jgi:hypothetical protein
MDGEQHGYIQNGCLIWMVTFPFNGGHASFEDKAICDLKSIGCRFLKLRAMSSSCFLIYMRIFFTGPILYGRTFKSFVALWAEDFDTALQLQHRCIVVLCSTEPVPQILPAVLRDIFLQNCWLHLSVTRTFQ